MKNRIMLAAALLAMLLVSGCASLLRDGRQPESEPLGCDDAVVGNLTPSQVYAGEVLAYFLKVTLGADGPPELREKWRTRGKDVPLDFESITRIMEDIENRKSSMMVLDTNILGLAKVLYYYNPVFNQFKGKRTFDSLYPSTELIALRLLLVQRLDSGRPPIDLDEVLRRRALLCDLVRLPTEEDYRATRLDENEYRLLRATIASEPSLIAYLYHPAILDVLEEMGIIAKKTEFGDLISRKRLPKILYGIRKSSASADKTVTVALLPSIIRGFTVEKASGDDMAKLVPGERYAKTVENFKREILEAAERAFLADSSHTAVPSAGTDARKSYWQKQILPRIRFTHELAPPEVIYPANAGEAIEKSSPDADLNLVVLGTDVYRCLDLDREKDSYPRTNRIYLDFSDIRHSAVEEEIETVARVYSVTAPNDDLRDHQHQGPSENQLLNR
jgi:hypothetical protein